MNRAFALVLDETSKGFNPAKFQETITKVKGILSWWHYLPTLYILIVEEIYNASDITQTVQAIDKELGFIVLSVNLKDHNGFLPAKAWEWITELNNGGTLKS